MKLKFQPENKTTNLLLIQKPAKLKTLAENSKKIEGMRSWLLSKTYFIRFILIWRSLHRLKLLVIFRTRISKEDNIAN